MIKFKTSVFDTHKVTLDNKVGEDIFIRCKRESPFTNIRNDFDGLEQQILKEICVNEIADMNIFCNILDLVVYLPKSKDKVNPGTQSPDMFMILSSN